MSPSSSRQRRLKRDVERPIIDQYLVTIDALPACIRDPLDHLRMAQAQGQGSIVICKLWERVAAARI